MSLLYFCQIHSCVYFSFCTGVSRELADDGKHFTTTVYGNGPGYQIANGSRPDVNDTVSCKCSSDVFKWDRLMWELHLLVYWNAHNTDLNKILICTRFIKNKQKNIAVWAVHVIHSINNLYTLHQWFSSNIIPFFFSNQWLPSAGCRSSWVRDSRYRRRGHLCQRSNVTPYSWGPGAELHCTCPGLCSLPRALWKLQKPCSSISPESAAASDEPLSFLLLCLRLE